MKYTIYNKPRRKESEFPLLSRELRFCYVDGQLTMPVEWKRKITNSSQSVEILKDIYKTIANIREEMWIIYLNLNADIIGFHQLAIGGIQGLVADNRHIIAGALISNSSSIIVCHNHPSGNIKPSQQDITLIRELQDCCKFFRINLLDNIIIAYDEFIEDWKYYSFADEGML